MIIEGAIFDIDGTVLDSMPMWNHVCEKFLLEEGIQPEPGLGDKLFAVTVEMGAEYMKENYPLEHYTIPEIMDKVNGIMEEFYRTEAEFKPGAKELLENLHQAGVKLTVASSTAKFCIEIALKRLGVLNYFTEIFSCAEIGVTKDKPDIFYMAQEAMETPVDKTWVFEDGLYSIKTAKAEGFKIAGVYDAVSEGDQEDIKKYSDIYITDFHQCDFIV